MIKYTVEKHITTRFLVLGWREGSGLKEVIADCPAEDIALTIKGMYEKAEQEDEGKNE